MNDTRNEELNREDLIRRIDTLLEKIEKRYGESKACKKAVEDSPFAKEKIAPVPYELFEKMFGGLKKSVNDLKKELNSDVNKQLQQKEGMYENMTKYFLAEVSNTLNIINDKVTSIENDSNEKLDGESRQHLQGVFEGVLNSNNIGQINNVTEENKMSEDQDKSEHLKNNTNYTTENRGGKLPPLRETKGLSLTNRQTERYDESTKLNTSTKLNIPDKHKAERSIKNRTQ